MSSRLADPTCEALIGLLTGQVVIELIVGKGCGGVVAGIVEDIAHFLGWAEGVRHEDGVPADAWLEQGRSGHVPARAFDHDGVSVVDVVTTRGLRVDLNQANAVELLAGEGPMCHGCEVSDAGPAGHPHE